MINFLDKIGRYTVNIIFIEKEGNLKGFECTLEIAWKTSNGKMEFDGLLNKHISTKIVVMIKAYHHNILI